MSIFTKIFGPKKDQEPNPVSEHAVLVYFTTQSLDTEEIFELEEQLEGAIAGAGTGELDGNEIAVDGSGGTFYMYGPDADRLFQSVESVLRGSKLTASAKVLLRYGPPQDGVAETVIELAS